MPRTIEDELLLALPLGPQGTKVASNNKIQEIVLSSSQATFDFQSIPNLYRHLRVIPLGRGDTAAFLANPLMRMNNDSGSNYYGGQRLHANGSTVVTADGASTTSLECGRIPAASAAAGIAATLYIDIPFYRETTFHKTFQTVMGFNGNYSAGNAYESIYSGNWLNTAAIDRLTFSLNAGNFIAGSIATLYGIA